MGNEITMGATAAEKRRMAEADEKRRKRKYFTTIHPPNMSTHVCHVCNRLFVFQYDAVVQPPAAGLFNVTCLVVKGQRIVYSLQEPMP